MLPQIIYIIIVAISVGTALSKHGETYKGKHNVWATIMGLSIALPILTWGGFFDPLLGL